MDLYHLNKFFPAPKGSQIEIVTNLASMEAFKRGHVMIRIEHIALGYMMLIEKISKVPFTNNAKYTALPWYVPPKEYVLRSKITYFKVDKEKSIEPEIHQDVVSFSKMYKKMMEKENVTIASFYGILLFMNSTMEFTSNPFLPSGTRNLNKCNSLNDFILYCNSKLPSNHRDDYLSNYFFIETLEEEISSIRKNNFEETHEEENLLSDLIENKNNNQTTLTLKSVTFSSPIELGMTTDITYRISKEKGNVIIGRENEIKRLSDILCKKDRNKVIMIGESGVGKTAIIEALAQKIVNGQVPTRLQGYHILQFDLSSLVAGARYRGDLEERSKKFFEDFKKVAYKVILCIDEIHLIVGLGETAESSSVSFSNLLKNFMQENNVKIIGTSSFKNYQKIEADKSLQRRFSALTVNEPSDEETARILESIKYMYEEEFNVCISKEAINKIISLSKRYIPERFFPDKALDVLDETCAIKRNLANVYTDNKLTVTAQDVLMCISEKTGIPIQKLCDFNNLKNLEDNLNTYVIGQSHVSKKLSRAIKRAQAGLNDENRPLASFMFIGPTGVGKTEISKTLANLIFSGKDNMVRFDMSEYMESHSVSKLIGSPPGYIGYDEAGLLTEKVRRHPYSLVLFDEFEKAHSSVWNILLQILDEGMLTDSKGERVNFKNTIIILTSNVGASKLSEDMRAIGFGNTSKREKDVMSEVKKKFSPEFLNRLDDIIQFNHLLREDIVKIAKLQIKRTIIQNLKEERNISVTVSDEVIEKIADLGYSEEYGARELQRTISREIKEPLADFILDNEKVKNISVKLNGDEIEIEKAKVKVLI